MGKQIEPLPLQLSFDWTQEEIEIERCAEHIRADLGVIERPDLDTILYLAERHGGEPQPAIRVTTGETEGEVIRVNPSLSLDRLPVVIFHELIHRLANGERYTYLNPIRTNLPRSVWLELLAAAVVGEVFH